METTNKISLDLIDDPKVAMRGNFDDDKLQQLMSSMREHGLIEPVVLRPVGGRYEVIAGHRRTRSARLLGWPMIESKIIEADEEKTLALRLAENSDRADVNPVDEACFIGECMLKYSKSEEDIAKIMNRSIEWVGTRVEVFNMPDYLQDHLRNERISLGAALWLSRIEDEQTRRYYANWAALNGVSVAGAKKWYLDLKARDFVLPAQDVEIKDEGGSVQQVVKMVQCDRCKQMCELTTANMVYVHPSNC